MTAIAAYIADKDTVTHRVCGTCGTLLPVEDFYKDGVDSQGNPKYRRDCKECYKTTRIRAAALKAKGDLKNV